MKTSLLTSTLLLFPALTTATFNLNTSGPDWDYTTSDLSNTTSQTCKDAYSASIDCDPTLLGLVASMRPAFKPTTTDIVNTCTSTCKDSLTAYVKGVTDACTADGDKAQESPGGSEWWNYILDPVEIVGELFQYTFARDCAQLANGTWCYFYDIPSASSFDCSDQCTVDFYTSAHDYAASSKWFNYYYLVDRGSWWEDQFVLGWKRIQECGLAGNDTSASTSTSTSGTLTKTASSSASGTAIDAVSTTGSAPTTAKISGGSSNLTSSASGTASSTAASTGSGNSLKAGLAAFGLVFMNLVYFCAFA